MDVERIVVAIPPVNLILACVVVTRVQMRWHRRWQAEIGSGNARGYNEICSALLKSFVFSIRAAMFRDLSSTLQIVHRPTCGNPEGSETRITDLLVGKHLFHDDSAGWARFGGSSGGRAKGL